MAGNAVSIRNTKSQEPKKIQIRSCKPEIRKGIQLRAKCELKKGVFSVSLVAYTL